MFKLAPRSVAGASREHTAASGGVREAALALDRHFERLGICARFGARCLFLSALARDVLAAQGLRAHTRLCTMRVGERGTRVFSLGQAGFAARGQIAARAVCIVEDRLLLEREPAGRVPRPA